MLEPTAALIARLRAGVNVTTAEPAQQLLYEHWVGQERWPVEPVALALLIGVAPAQWSAHVEMLGLAVDAEQLLARMVTDLALGVEQVTTALGLRAWAHSHGVALPAAAESLLDFVARTLPRLAVDAASVNTPAASSTDREAVLGAALALVTRFTEDCLDEGRMFDSARIARLMLAQGALWFADGPPRLDEPAIAKMIERYISGF